MISIIAALSLPLLDRMRGDGKPPVPRPIIKALMGAAVLATLLGTLCLPWQLLVIGILGHMVGESIGWGAAIGAGLSNASHADWKMQKAGTAERKPEWYLKVPGVGYSWQTALLFRGALWAAIPAVGLWLYVSPQAAGIVIVAHSIGMVGGIYAKRVMVGKDGTIAKVVSKFTASSFESGDRWAMQEIYRGAIIAILLLVGSCFVSVPAI